MKVAIFSTRSYDRNYFARFNQAAGHELTYFDAPLNADTTELSRDVEAVCVFVNDRLDRETIEKLSKNGVRLIALRCAGFNNVDLIAADEFGLTVMRVPAYSPHAVAEHATALILTLNRKTHKAYNRIRENNFSLEKLTGFNLFGKTVGVIGTGVIGSVFCNIMLGFGCRVVAFDISESEELRKKGVEYLPFDSLLAASDIVSLHCPLTSETHHLIDSAALSKMKSGAMLINTGRGELIKTEDVIAALKSSKLGYLGIDVYEQEEKLFFRDLSEMIIPDDLIARLMTFHNVLITAHQGFFTDEALGQIATTTLQNITDFANGVKNGNEVSTGR